MKIINDIENEQSILLKYLDANLATFHSYGVLELYKDTFHNGNPRIENIASLLCVAVHYNTIHMDKYLELIFTLIDELYQSYLKGEWLEFGYNRHDDSTGYKGTVTTGFIIVALSYALHNHPEHQDSTEIKKIIFKTCDDLFMNENGGKVIKADINRNNVINTNLMAALSFYFATLLLNPNSNRHTQYTCAIKRIVRESICHQNFSGLYPYQSDSPRVSFLYHSMVTGLIDFLNKNLILDPFISYVNRFSGLSFFKKFKGTIIDWELETLSDKSGAPWIYSWALNIDFMSESPKRRHLLFNILKDRQNEDGFFHSDFDKRSDPFYSAWVSFSFFLYLFSCNQVRGYIPAKYSLVKLVILKFLYFIIVLKMYKSFAYRKFMNQVLNCGMSTTSWRE